MKPGGKSSSPIAERTPICAAGRRLPSSLTLATGFALIACAVWLWTHFCYFPWHPWNDVRLAPAVMALTGENVYSLPGEGIITTWIYGPVPLWLLAPAGLARTAPGALLIAATLNMAYTLTAIVLVCATWPSAADAARRFGAALLCIALWRDGAWDFVTADSFTLALGLLSNLLLAHSRCRTKTGCWAAALLCAAALGSKQTSFGLAIAQVIWVAAEQGWRPAIAHVARIAACGGALLILMAIQFDPAGAWFGMVQLPSRFPFAPDLSERFSLHRFTLAWQVGAPLAVLLLTRGRWLRRSHPLRLPTFTFLGTLPLGLLGLISFGGNANALVAFWFLLPSLLVYSVAALPATGPFRLLPTAVTLAVLTGKWLSVPNRPWRPLIDHFETGKRIAQTFEGGSWFAWNPTLSYYVYRKWTHAEDGIFARELAGYDTPARQLEIGMPPSLAHIVVGAQHWGIALAYADPKGQKIVQIFGTPWSLVSLPPRTPPN